MPEVAKSPDAGSQLDDTVRIERRRTILAQLEAALLADKLAVAPADLARTGTDPYNSGPRGVPGPAVWNAKRPR